MEKEKEQENITTFDLDALRVNLPQKRKGLSRYYTGKSRSFGCIADVHCLEDLMQKQRPNIKKRKKQLDKQVPPLPCWRVSSSNQSTPPILGV